MSTNRTDAPSLRPSPPAASATSQPAATSTVSSQCRCANDCRATAAIGLAADVRGEDSVTQLVETVMDRLDGNDLLANKAGIGMHTSATTFRLESSPPGGGTARLPPETR